MPQNKNEWTVSVRKDGGAVRVYRYGKLREEISPGKDTYNGATAMKFAQELDQEIRKQSDEMRRKADRDVQTEPNLKNDATGSAVTGKPSPTTSNMQDKVAKLQAENRKVKAQLGKERKRHMFEIKARRGAKLAEILVKRGALEEDADAVKAFVKDVALMSDDEIGRLERKAAGDSEFGSVEEAERAERSYKREARMLRRKADDSQESGDSEAADRLDTSADDAEKNAGCCRSFIRAAAHKEAGEKGKCENCDKPKFLCDGKCKEDCDMKDAADESIKKEAAKCENCTCDPCTCDDCHCPSCKGKSASAEETEEGEEVDKTADRDVQTEPNLKNDAKGVAVTGKPSPNNNTKAADEGAKKEASDKASDGTKPTAESLREQHLATAKMYRKMADEAEEGGDFVKADTFDHKAEVCEDLSKDAAIETANPEPELAGVNDATEISESVEREASEGASTEDTDGPSEGSAKTASAEDNGEIEITDDLIEAAVTPREVFDLRSASSGQRRREPSRVDPNASGVTRIASCDENAASNDPDISALESLWEGAPRE